MKVKEESKKVSLKFNIQKTKIRVKINEIENRKKKENFNETVIF